MRPPPSDRLSFRNGSPPGRRIVLPTIMDCPHCAAENPASGSTCSACGKTLAIYIGAPSRAGSYSLASVMLVVAATSVGLGLARAEPPLGVMYFALVLPALCRTLYLYHRERAWGTPPSRADTAFLFFASMALFLVFEFVVGVVWIGGVILLAEIFGKSWFILLASLVPVGLFAWWLGRILLVPGRR